MTATRFVTRFDPSGATVNNVARLVTVSVLGLFGVGMATQTERVGRVARRPNDEAPEWVALGLGSVAGLLGAALVVFWLLG